MGTTNVSLADGSTQASLVALASTHFGGVEKQGLVLLHEGPGDILLGVQFLKAYELILLVSHGQSPILDTEEGLRGLAPEPPAADS